MTEIAPVDAPQTVRESWKTLVERGGNRYVTVNYNALDGMIADNKDVFNPDWKAPDWKIPGVYPKDDWAFATQEVLMSSVNFMFNTRESKGASWTTEIDGKSISGSSALRACIFEAFGEDTDITADQISHFADYFKPGMHLDDIPMAIDRRVILSEFSNGLRQEYGGSIRELINASKTKHDELRAFNNGDGLLDRLADRAVFGNAFYDTSSIDDLPLPFNKRLHLAAILLYGRSQDSSTLPHVTDIDRVGSVPDYQVPRLYRHKGALVYNRRLASWVDHYDPLGAGRQAENEIRAATVEAQAYQLDLVNKTRSLLGLRAINMAHIDYWGWREGRSLKNLENPPLQHYTETTAY